MPILPSSVLHATALRIGDKGILLTGPSGSGKSQLAYELMQMAKRDGLSFGLIADDQVAFKVDGQNILVTFPPKSPDLLKGKIEMRGFGFTTAPFCNAHKLTHAFALYTDESVTDSLRQLPPKQDWPKISLPIDNSAAHWWPTCPVFSGNITHCAKIIALHAGFALPL